MNSISLGSFILTPCKFRPFLQTKHQPIFRTLSPIPLTQKPTFLRATDSNIDAPISLPEGASFVSIPEIIEKDWSVLDCAEHRTTDRIIASGNIEQSSRVLVSTGSEDFVDSLAGLTPSVFVVHDSLLTLACIKEKYDRVKCWQGEIIYVPEKWAPFDAVFLYFLPALPFKLHQILESLAGKCAPGGRVIISHPKGKEVLEQQRKQYPDVVVSDLPNKTYLQSVAAAHSFDVAEFVDEPGLYLAVLICSRA
ncbi:hypothetical protein AAZX31_03G128700 [Glycine max]|uniref:Uncharacterized protein n=2 Tax=Glycine subgen. Soja TaxID=1462606 RepID=I1JNM9_SOYBN|nr:S-adenosylmethionine-dependent methyltransferase superfamily protein [Glycine max]XP_028225419.1 uncharacterized protein LOC114406798 [Glycine soja]KAG5055218.1 hypothetical protein JHK85_007728 [Glycine max]KAH1070041.1 hypothetical protein GYH30_007250 [Glycine max]KHN07449.1 hypothetical protein glysoja_012747 [Glycine soja]KRH67094.1 hypothetical protein GLYMA_03G146600v4 [Glycine max]RZC20716.1 hypothetical protein D0Y65_007182 [Glycine soja]|eukprot:NP_001236218.2 S-adenosylmethionine-dependent methyltransferase superfamily protein [Glycine max]